MSMFWCDYHDRSEDSDKVGFEYDEESGAAYCEEASAILEMAEFEYDKENDAAWESQRDQGEDNNAT